MLQKNFQYYSAMLLYLEVDVSVSSVRASAICFEISYLTRLQFNIMRQNKQFRLHNVQECRLFDELYRVLSDHDVIYGASRS